MEKSGRQLDIDLGWRSPTEVEQYIGGFRPVRLDEVTKGVCMNRKEFKN